MLKIILKLAALTLLVYANTYSDDKFSEGNKMRMNRNQMVKEQIKRRGIRDPQVLNAMLAVKRHLFVPDSLHELAYYDGALPIDNNQTISQPYIVAYMTEALNLNSSSKVLEIGTGSGYQAAVLGEICDSVFSIEIITELAERSTKLLDSLGYSNITVKHGDGYIGWEEFAPYDAIIVTAAPPYTPQPLLDQLAEGGRMIIPVGTSYQKLILFENEQGEIVKTELIPVRFVPMTGDVQKKVIKSEIE